MYTYFRSLIGFWLSLLLIIPGNPIPGRPFLMQDNQRKTVSHWLSVRANDPTVYLPLIMSSSFCFGPSDPNNIQTVIGYLSCIIHNRTFNLVKNIMDDQGVIIGAPYGTEPGPLPGYNNYAEVSQWFTKTLNNTTPVCWGYEAPGLVFVYFDNWSELTIYPNSTTNKVSFIFYQNVEGWKLGYIVYVPGWGWPNQNSLIQCPGQ